MSGYDYTTLGMDLMIGAGYAPVVNEKLTLGVFGVAGFTGIIAESEKKYSSFYLCDVKYTQTYGAFDLGANVTAAYTPKNTFSVWASLTGAYVCPGALRYEADPSKGSKQTWNWDTGSNYRVIPEIGVCWRF